MDRDVTRWRRSPISGGPGGARWFGGLAAALVVAMGGGAGGRLPVAAAADPINIGVLTESWGPNPQTVGLRDGLLALGYVENVDFAIGVRFTRGDASELVSAARELLAHGAAILFVSGGSPVEAARAATSRAPIVFAGGDDPVARGLVKSIARPGGNITGVVDLGNELAGKRLEIFREIVPDLRRVLVVYAAGIRWDQTEAQAYRRAADVLGITLVEKPVRSQAEAETIFGDIGAQEVQGVLVSHSVAWNVPGYAIRAGDKLPAMFSTSFYVEKGGLVSYGPDYYATGRQAARLVDKIIKGARPGDIPIESNPLIELTVNIATARKLGLEIPPSIRLRASRLIE